MTTTNNKSNTTNTEAAAAEVPAITLTDFSSLIQIIDVASRRGAFEGKELTSVGGLRDKIEAFLRHYAPKQGAAETSGDGEDSSVTESAE